MADLRLSNGALKLGSGSAAVASALLEMASTSQGFLPPRMSTTQINAITSPAEGLLAYDSVLHAPYFYNGTAWTAMGGGGGGSGDVVGPSGATNEAVLISNGTTGKLLKNSDLIYNSAGQYLRIGGNTAGAGTIYFGSANSNFIDGSTGSSISIRNTFVVDATYHQNYKPVLLRDTGGLGLWNYVGGDVVLGNGALSTSATAGHLYINSCAGTPTGVPTGYTGTPAMIYDSTNDKLYVYRASWKQVGITSGSGTSGNLTKWSGTNSITNSVWTEDANGAMTALLAGGSAPVLTLNNGTTNQKLISFKVNGTELISIRGSNVSGQTGVFFVTHTSQIGTETDYYAYYSNVGASTGSGGNPFSGTGTYGAYLNAVSSGASSSNVGCQGYAYSGNRNIGLWGIADTVTGTTPKAIGVMGVANTLGSPNTYIGGYFAITTTQSVVGSYPGTGLTAALIANNGNTAVDIFNCLSNASSVFKVANLGNVVVGNTALSTSATDGFLYIPTCAGTPTGTPTGFSATVPLVVDSTNNKLYVYVSGAWKGVVLL